MAAYSVNKAGAERCRELISARQCVLDSEWNEVQPDADALNAYLENHSWAEDGAWHPRASG